MEIENKVAKKAIIQLDIEKWLPKSEEIAYIDIKSFLFKEMIVKESDFREKVELLDIELYKNKYICFFNSTKAIVPLWAYMLFSSTLARVSLKVYFNKENFKSNLITDIINEMDLGQYKDKRLIIKGCGNEALSHQPYLTLIQRLTPIARSIAFGEACSMIPIYKK